MKNNTQPALKERIEKALEDFTKGRASMHVPPLDTDVDVVLAECSDRLSELKARCAALAAENAGLKAAFDKPQAYLSWHTIPPTWEDPLPCGEYLDVHDDAGHKNSDGTDCWPVYAKPEINTPVTDAFLAEVRASGVDASIEHLIKKLEGTGHIGVPVMALEWLAQKLRKGGAA
ncbi:hypothetical protein [Escherichia coli]|uniref:hypothetical protein n=1 Tax=Escherichia coli TaxID=562 RepID=UPI0010B56B56|nr:hypothetical protein [Escherichia coli]VFS88694.1 phage protein [Escherichia coli]